VLPPCRTLSKDVLNIFLNGAEVIDYFNKKILNFGPPEHSMPPRAKNRHFFNIIIFKNK
jgi:hypothetical protein